jgi:hypothetical protein
LPIIPALRRQKQEDHKSEASLGYITELYLKKKKKAFVSSKVLKSNLRYFPVSSSNSPPLTPK